MPVTIDMSVLNDLKALGPAGAAGLDRAVKSTAKKGRQIIIDTIAGVYKCAPGVVSKALKVPSGTPILTAEIKIKGDRLPLYGFAPQPNMPFMGGRREPGVNVDITSRKMVKQSFAPHEGQYAFIAKMASGHIGVFERSGKFGRTPKKLGNYHLATGLLHRIKVRSLERIQEMFTLAVSQMEQAEKVQPIVNTRLQEQLNIEATREYGNAVKKIFNQAAFEAVRGQYA